MKKAVLVLVAAAALAAPTPASAQDYATSDRFEQIERIVDRAVQTTVQSVREAASWIREMWIAALSQEPCDGTCVNVPSPEEECEARHHDFWDDGNVGPLDCSDLFEDGPIIING